MLVSEVLHDAADAIECGGWWQCGRTCTGPKPSCAGNAIWRRRFAAGLQSAFAAQTALYTYLGGTHIRDIWAWNDAQGRTAEEVIATLRACAVIEAAKEAAPSEHAAELVTA